MNHYYFPRNDKDLSTWAENFKTKIESLAPTLGLSLDQVTALKSYCDAILDKTTKITEQKKQIKALQEEKKRTKNSAKSSKKTSLPFRA